MGPEDSHRRGRATAPRPPGVPDSDGPWPPGPRPARGSPGGSKSVNRQEGPGPRRLPAVGRPQAAAGARLGADHAARELRAPSGGGRAGGGGRGAAGPAGQRARRDRPGRAARRAGERARPRPTRAQRRLPPALGLQCRVGHSRTFEASGSFSREGRDESEQSPGRRSPGPLAGSCPHTVLTRLHPQCHLGGEARGLAGPGGGGADTCPGRSLLVTHPRTP